MMLPDSNTTFAPDDAAAAVSGCTPPSPVLTYADLHPRVQLWLFQGMRCAIGRDPIPFNARALRDLDGARISALVCPSCVLKPEALVHPPVLSAPALLRLRLTQGPLLMFNRLTSEVDRAALAAKDWDHFSHPYHALWAEQDGRCAVYDETTHGSVAEATERFVVADYDPTDGKVDGLICKQCQPLESKVSGAAVDVWRRYRAALPGRRSRVTRGLTRAFVLDWNRDLYNNRRWSGRGVA